MNNFFTSIMIPTYKREKKLKLAIDSVFSQTYKNWEIIVIDNNSNDGSEEMINHMKNKFKKIIEKKITKINSSILGIGSNDETFLNFFAKVINKYLYVQTSYIGRITGYYLQPPMSFLIRKK